MQLRCNSKICPSAGSRLLVSSHKSVHYLYDVLRPHLPPVAQYTGHTAASFYIRAAFSPDSSHFISGSSENKAYIWQVVAPAAMQKSEMVNTICLSVNTHGAIDCSMPSACLCCKQHIVGFDRCILRPFSSKHIKGLPSRFCGTSLCCQ